MASILPKISKGLDMSKALLRSKKASHTVHYPYFYNIIHYAEDTCLDFSSQFHAGFEKINCEFQERKFFFSIQH